MEGTLFTEIKLDDKPLKDCELVYKSENNDYRLYVVKEEEHHSFRAMAVEFVSCYSDGDIWECPDLRVEQLFHVIAYFDGVRHLEFNREGGDMAGYIYYPNIQGMIELFEEVKKICKGVCREFR